ncbi:MAG: radical SAM protein [Spirochaetales bacterium]|nr:radical SAM protein [Spirochaetales bacterium]
MVDTKKISWVYGFWNSLAPYAYARLEDEVVILPPNLVYKTNKTGASLLAHLSAGGVFEDIPGINDERVSEIEAFFVSLKAAYEGRPVLLERVSYGFDFTKLPVLGEIAITYRCNNRCRFCYAGCGDVELAERAFGAKELDTEGFKRVIDIFRDEAKIPFFSFTGGEPLVRPDVEELAAYAVSRGLRVNLVTNGRLATPARAASLFASGLTTAQVSLEAPEAAIHDDLCGAEGAFEDTVAGIRALMAAGISVQTNSTMTRANRNALLELPAFVATLGVRRMSMNLFIPVGSGAKAADLFVPYSETGDFIDEVRKRAHEAGVEFFWYSPIPMCMYNPIARGLGNKSCAACDGLLSVSPSGDVLPCSSWPEPVGSLIEDGFRAVWFSDKAAWFKEKRYAPDECRACSSFTACQGACPLYWRYAGYDELLCAKEGRLWNTVSST